MEKSKKIIPITAPSITESEIKMVDEAVRLGWGTNHSTYIKEFEKKFAEFIGVGYAIATSSCHGALHLALKGLGIKEGDEVIVPDITWIASAAVVTYVGATPVFADMDKKTWCIDPDSVEKSITGKTKAIIPVTLYGHPPDMDRIMEIAKKHNLFVIEDAAQSVGSKYKGKRPGSIGDCGTYSFHGTKIMTTGEGGMFVTGDKKLYDRVSYIADLGRSADRMYWNTEIGLKYKMTNMQAALGIAQLERIDELADKKRQIFEWYRERLEKVDGLQINVELPECFNTYWMVTVILDKKFGLKKEELTERLKEYNIATRPFFYPLSSMPPFEGAKADNPVSYGLSPYGINLPCGHDLTKEEVNYVCDSLLEIINA